MISYRAYEISERGRIVGPATVIEAADDAEAESKAEALPGRHLELWCNSRRVCLVSKSSPATA